MKIGHLELFVRDPLAARDFYTRVLGFELVTVQDDQFVWLKHGDFEILLRPGANRGMADRYAESGAGIVLYTEDVPRTVADLQARGLLFDGCDGAANCPTFTDPDGHWFQIVNPRKQ